MPRSLILLLLLSAAIASSESTPFTYVYPKPGSSYHQPETTIILKAPDGQLRALSGQEIKVTGDRSGRHDGSVIKSGNTLIFKPRQKFMPGEKVTVELDKPAPFTFRFFICDEIVTSTPDVSAGKMRDESVAGAQENVEPVRLINGVAVPSDFPNINTVISGETAPGRLFIASTFFDSDSRSNYVFILENDGTPYFYRKYPKAGLGSADFHMHPNGLISFYQYLWSEDGFHVILDHNFAEVDTFRAEHGYRTDNHDMLLLANGHALLTAENDVKVDMSAVIDGGAKDAIVQGNYVQEVDDQGNVYWEWRSWDHLNILDVDQINLKAGNIDYVHLNSIAIDYDGNYILSLRNMSEVCKINSKTGEFIWRFGGKNNQFDIDDNTRTSQQHCVRPVPGKPNHYTIYDNGNTRSPQFTRAVEYALDTNLMKAAKVWEYRYSKANFKNMMGSVQRLPNGNTYIDWSAWPPGLACEVDANNNLVYELEVQGSSSYRSSRFVWDGMMLHPYLLLENMNNVIRLIFNKFGDSHVDHYVIYTGTSPDAMTQLDSTSNTYMDVDAMSLGSLATFYFGVTAVNESGAESEMSNVENVWVDPIRPRENIVRNGAFDSSAEWSLQKSNGAGATGAIDDQGQYKVSITNGGNNYSDVRLQQDRLAALNGYDYVFEFDAYASKSRVINALVQSSTSPPINYGSIGYSALKTHKTHFKYTFPMNHTTDNDAQVVFQCGLETGDVFIDNVLLYYVDLQGELKPLPQEWQHQDIGDVSRQGTAGILNDRFLVQGSGNDIWGASDEFQFVYRQMKGDGEIFARVYSLTETNEWCKAGVMIRESLAPSSKHAIMAATGAQGMAFQRRMTDGGESLHTPGTSANAPQWVKLVRENSTLTGYESNDGENWSLVGSEDIPMNETVFVGLAVTAHNDGSLCEALFENVTIVNAFLGAEDQKDHIPHTAALYPAFPNPFNAKTRIRFVLPKQSHVKLTVFDIRGRETASLVDKTLSPGNHTIDFDGANRPSGLYFYRLETNDQLLTDKMLLVR